MSIKLLPEQVQLTARHPSGFGVFLGYQDWTIFQLEIPKNLHPQRNGDQNRQPPESTHCPQDQQLDPEIDNNDQALYFEDQLKYSPNGPTI